MDFLRWLESIRTPVGDFLMSTLTHLGQEMLFIAVALVFFWCIDKKRGYFLLFTGFVGTVCNQILKMAFRVPRPWVLDPAFRPVESAVEGATGYSFPSGHTQCATNLYGGIARSSRRRAVQIGGVVIALLVAFTRMYLGVHTPADVLTSLAVGTVLVLSLYAIIERIYDTPKYMYIAVGAILLLNVANLLFVMLFPFPADVDPVNLSDARELAWKLTFVSLALCVVYPLDRHVIRFEVKAVWWAQLLKLVIGVALVFGIRTLLKAPCNALFGELVGGGVRYFLMVVVAGSVWPLTFRFWAKLK